MILDKNELPVEKGFYKGEGSKLYGPVYVGYIHSVGKDHVNIQDICGFGTRSPEQVSKLEKIEEPVKFVRWLEDVHSPSSRVTQFMKSILWDLVAKRGDLLELSL